jgi:hypothetical protein
VFAVTGCVACSTSVGIYVTDFHNHRIQKFRQGAVGVET